MRFPFEKKRENKDVVAVADKGLNSIFRDFEDFFDLAFSSPFDVGFTKSSLRPAMDITQKDGKLLIDVELPGIDKKDIKLNIKDDILTISGHRDYKKEIKKESFCHVERSSGYISRSLQLPKGIDQSKIKAKHNNGLLKISVPLTEKKELDGKELEIE